MKKQILYYVVFAITSCTLCYGCKKENSFLEKKPNISLAVPETLNEAELLSYNEELFNGYSSCGLGNLSCDDTYITDATYFSSDVTERNTYTFEKDIYQSSTAGTDWNRAYSAVYVANVILDALDKINPSPSEIARFNAVKGHALFLRAMYLYSILQVFTLPYDVNSAKTDPGIPYPESSNFNIRHRRSTVADIYDKIIKDILTATALLPENMTSPARASKVSCNALLSRVYLSMGDYANAMSYSEKTLASYSQMDDYNSITPERSTLTTKYLKEDIFHAALVGNGMTSSLQPDSVLYASYANNDLRKSHFFRPTTSGIGLAYRGTYDFKGNFYCGLAVDEILLIRAECYARKGLSLEAQEGVNKLLVNRFKKGTFIPYNLNSADEILKIILLERKKELYLRGVRWTDLRRLNKEPAFAKDVIHVINGRNYVLKANDKKYALPIPQSEILGSGISQNER